VAATAFMTNHGHEGWHPDPAFSYADGGDPMFDRGPYYLTALITLLGPVRRVTGSPRITVNERTITSQPRSGDIITVTTPTQVTGVLDFSRGALAYHVLDIMCAVDDASREGSREGQPVKSSVPADATIQPRYHSTREDSRNRTSRNEP